MKSILSTLLVAAVLSAGCAQTPVARNGQVAHAAYLSRPDYFKTRQTIVGSNIPIAPGVLPYSNVSATTPPESIDREHPSLYPTEPVVGATPNTEPATRAVNVGAGPAGSSPVLPISN